MRIDRLRLENFRSYSSQTVEFDRACNVIYGDNAQGKTNLLEAIVCLSCGRSPRTRTDRELIRFGAEGFLIEGTIQARDREFVSRIEAARGRRKKISINKVPARTAGELSQVLGTVFFSPEDLFLIREGAAALGEYNRLWEHKTRILRDSEEKPDLLGALPDFNLRMAETGAVLIHYRARFAQVLARYAAAAHGECSGGREKLELRYQTVKTVGDPLAGHRELVAGLLEHQRLHAEAELLSRQCLSGPHKDDLEVLLDGLSAKSFASQGQTRTAALAMKLAAREIHREIVGEYPVLLLDDVLSELDPRRQEFVLNRLGDGQVFITCCEDDRLGAMLQGRVFHIRDGKVEGGDGCTCI